MQKLKVKPYALLLRRDELRRILPEEISINAEGKATDLFGVVLDIKAMDKIDNPKIFLEYTFGENPRKKIFFDVDTQKDFMNKNGALYVQNAENIKSNLAKLSKFALDNEITVVASMDTHYGDEEHKEVETELKKWGGPFPNHCMAGSEGQTSIDETKGESNIVIIEKQTYDVFSNPKTKKILEGTEEAVVYGVATDYCVKAAVLGMLKMGIKVFVVTDAIMGVEQKTTKEAEEEMNDKGAIFIQTLDIINGT